MGVTGLVMAGGRGVRMNLQEEKPMLNVGGKPMIEHVIEALERSSMIDDIVVAVSKYTPKTAEFAGRFPVKVLETPGEGYVADLRYAIRKFNLGIVLTVSADLPLITSDIIDDILRRYYESGRSALTVAVRSEMRRKLGLTVEYADEGGLTPAGINVIDGRRIDEYELDEDIYVTDREEAAVNVNTPQDLEAARRLLSRKSDAGLSGYGELEDVCSKIKALLEEAVKDNLSDGILLSGGLDTSILATVASKFTSLKAVTVAFEAAEAPDLKYAALMAKRLGIEHSIHIFNTDELYRSIREVIRILKTFDPMEIRNSVTIYIGLKVAEEHGLRTVMTGDGCDELLAGYSFLFNLDRERLRMELKKLWSVMMFSSIPLARALGIEAKLPYLHPKFKSFAMNLDPEYKIQRKDGRIYGKWILRKAFEKDLPDEIIWRVKTPIEYGSGTTVLPEFFDQRISEREFHEKREKYLIEDGVKIRSKEHLFYYEVYRSIFGVPGADMNTGRTCPQCNSNVPEGATYCRVCGAYPI